MSESTSPARAAPGRPAKRQKTDADLRRQRKREADRMAQKNSRERRRSHIDHLENMINILRKENGNAVTCELMETVLQLRSENERLRRIINSARTSLSLAACEAPASADTGNPHTDITYAPRETRDDISRGANTRIEEFQNKDDELENCQTSSKNALLQVRHSTSNSPPEDMGINRQEFLGYLGIEPSDNSGGTLHFTDSWMDKMAGGIGAVKKRPVIDPFAFLGPLATAMPPAGRPQQDTMLCPVWERSNRIYAQISQVSPAAASQALGLSSAHYADMILKAVINGWNTLNSAERANPIMRTLGDMDQVFAQLDRVSRAAFMYKSHMLLKYHLGADKHNLDEMPEWQRPSLSQRTKQHPIALDFFVWPALRDRLIANDHDYFATTSDFSDSFRRNYKFNWPFPFEDAYVYDRQANTYRISPIFERYHKNIRYWGVQKPFFERFPELVHDIVCHDDDGGDGGPVPRIQAVDTMAEGGGSTADKIFSGMFTEGELTELFNDYPQLA